MDICSGENRYTPECLNKWFCPQISGYFVKGALALVIVYIVVTWLLWAFWRYCDKIDWGKASPFVLWVLGGNPNIYENKVRIELFIRDKLEKVLIGFLVILWWFYK